MTKRSHPTNPTTLQPLNAAVLSDTLDSLGLMQQAMKPFMRPLDDTLQLIGRARTGLYMPVYGRRAGENPYEVEIALVDDLAPRRRGRCSPATAPPIASRRGASCSPPRSGRAARPAA